MSCAEERKVLQSKFRSFLFTRPGKIDPQVMAGAQGHRPSSPFNVFPSFCNLMCFIYALQTFKPARYFRPLESNYIGKMYFFFLIISLKLSSNSTWTCLSIAHFRLLTFQSLHPRNCRMIWKYFLSFLLASLTRLIIGSLWPPKPGNIFAISVHEGRSAHPWCLFNEINLDCIHDALKSTCGVYRVDYLSLCSHRSNLNPRCKSLQELSIYFRGIL